MNTNETLATILGISVSKQIPDILKRLFKLIPANSRLVIHHEDLITQIENITHYNESNNGSYRNYMRNIELRFFYNVFKEKYKEVEELWHEDINGNVSVYYSIPKVGIYYKILDHKTFVVCNVCSEYNDICYRDSTMIASIDHMYRFKYTFIGANADFYINKIKRLCYHAYDIKFSRLRRKSYIVTSYIFTKDGDWYSRYNVTKPMKNIIMDKAVKRELMDKIKNFLGSASIYKENHIPYRLGILLYGSPGTGKTSLAYSLGLMLNCSVSIVNANNIMDCVKDNRKFYLPSELSSMNAIKRKNYINGIVLIDEIDSLTKSNEKFSLRKDQIVSFIDNIEEGSIIIGTTNSIDDIDPATIRPGRFDIHIEMEKFDKDLALEMIRSYNIEDSFADKFEYPIMPAELQFAITQEIYKRM